MHDPIYQGAGPLGLAGIPQPKPGAVTKAHGGVLFIDEIGELHATQLNRLLKVLEDRRVQFESAYYSRDDQNLPPHIHDIFERGLPADFRLIGATTRQPEEIPAAIRSRCLEIFFRPLSADEVERIARRAAARIPIDLEEAAVRVVRRYCQNGREAVNMVQIAAGLAWTESRAAIAARDVEWVANTGQYTPRHEVRIQDTPDVGLVHGLAVYGPNLGAVIEVEAVAVRARPDRGRLTVTGVVDEEEMGVRGRTVRRRSMARNSVENVLTALRALDGPDPSGFDIHVNFPGGVPLDGPSAGTAMAVAVFSAMTGRQVPARMALTGEVSIRGHVRAVGGVSTKLEAARKAGLAPVLIPRENWQDLDHEGLGADVIPVDTLADVIRIACEEPPQAPASDLPASAALLSASGASELAKR